MGFDDPCGICGEKPDYFFFCHGCKNKCGQSGCKCTGKTSMFVCKTCRKGFGRCCGDEGATKCCSKKMKTCLFCNGNGSVIENNQQVKCKNCKGDGKILIL